MTAESGAYVVNDLRGPRLTREQIQSMAVACILMDHGRCDYDPDCRSECHAPSPGADLTPPRCMETLSCVDGLHSQGCPAFTPDDSGDSGASS